MLVTSIFTFYHNVFYHTKDKNHHFSNNDFVFCICFHFGQGQHFVVCSRVYSLPNDKFLDLSKLKAFADDKINVTEKLKFVFGIVENIVRKGENAGYQHFLLFPQCFQKALYTGSLKVVIVWSKVKDQILLHMYFCMCRGTSQENQTKHNDQSEYTFTQETSTCPIGPSW